MNANALDAGARADGKADDSAVIQGLLDGFAKPYSTGVLELPIGTYRITKPLVYRGDYGYGVRICGEASAAQPSGTVLKWDGPPGEAVLSLRGCTSTTVEHLAIDCGTARTGISIEYDADSGKGTSGVYLGHLYITGGAGPNGSAIVAGYRPDGTREDRQCDKIVISNSLFVGSGKPGTTRYGVLLGWGNCKNFAIRDCGFVGFGTAIKFGGSGYCIVDGFAGGGQTICDIEAATGNMLVLGGNSENSARFLSGSTGAHSGSVTISGFSWSSDVASGPMISYQGFLKLEGNYFFDDSAPDAVPRVEMNATPGGPFSVLSNGNFYKRATGRPPITDTWGNPLDPSRVRSFGDYGGAEGSLEMFAEPARFDDLRVERLSVGSIQTEQTLRWIDATGKMTAAIWAQGGELWCQTPGPPQPGRGVINGNPPPRVTRLSKP